MSKLEIRPDYFIFMTTTKEKMLKAVQGSLASSELEDELKPGF